MNNHRIAVIGQGYVGLPLALEFAKHFPVYGFDVNTDRVKELNSEKTAHWKQILHCFPK